MIHCRTARPFPPVIMNCSTAKRLLRTSQYKYVNFCILRTVFILSTFVSHFLSARWTYKSQLTRRLFPLLHITKCRSQWRRGSRLEFAAARLMGLRVRIPPIVWMSVSYECCVLSVESSAHSRSLVQGSPTECDREALITRRPWLTRGCSVMEKKNIGLSVLHAAVILKTFPVTREPVPFWARQSNNPQFCALFGECSLWKQSAGNCGLLFCQIRTSAVFPYGHIHG